MPFRTTLARAVSGIKKVETVITGHSPVMKWSDFEELAAFHKDFFEWARTQQQAGRPVDGARSKAGGCRAASALLRDLET